MKKSLAIVAVCLMAAPAMAGEIPQGALVQLGLGGMEVMSDAEGMQVRGRSSNAAAGGSSLLFGQLVFNTDSGTQFVAGSDFNHYRATAENAGLNASSTATGEQGSELDLTLGPIVNFSGLQFDGVLSGRAGFAISDFSGAGFANGF